ncbi:PREDICTED: nuclear receptor-binding factor 2-like [Polistes dominula]|uniref:Nuclear receptor-binding factor 2-like n=1 Tax=Polistes dominula TaxID=743375 RepID=A0ABM1IBC1_POLDO|nr:PREDICTED: nuclear receptor-binding factor 2-like [Polistes dominula]
MEASALNLAHARQRRADAYLREGRFEEAAECHEAVANLLTKAFIKLQSNLNKSEASSVNSSSYKPSSGSMHTAITLESLALQRDYHKRQAAIVRMKHVQYEEYKIDLEILKRSSKQISKQNERGNSAESTSDKNDTSLRQAIFKTIQEQDSLISLILVPDSESSNSSKYPKDTTTVIEELKTVNSHLRSLVESLLTQLEIKEKEVTELKERLRTVSVSSNDETRPEETHSLNLPPLPPLTPLEMPLFDFTAS